MLVWPFSFFSYLAQRLLLPVEHVLPWFGFAMRGSILLISGVTTVLTPFFLFLTVVNNTEDSLAVRVIVSLIHAVWWSLVLCIVGFAFLLVAVGLPALLIDIVSMLMS